MIIVNTEKIEGRRIVETIGLVKGSTIRAKWFGKDIIASVRNLIGGELKEYTQMFDEAREQAVERMSKEAEKKGANAVINVRFTSAQVAQGSAELLAYGTAVKIE
ncbi:MAG: YbjQ family protein [Candidatus Hydrothermarchaeaceae archaeon]